MSGSIRRHRSPRIISRIVRLFRNTRGAMAIEFAFVMPMLMLMMFAIGQMAFAMYLSFNMHSVMQETARTAVADETMTTAQIQTLAQGNLSAEMATDATVAATLQVLSGVTFVEIRGTYMHEIAIPFMPSINFPIRSEVRVPRGAV